MSGPKPSKTNEPKPDKREAILAAALALFAARGFHGTAVPEVSERAGVAAGTLYRYFESKEALVNALYQRCKGQLFSFLMADFPYDAPPRQQFHEFWHRLGHFAERHEQVFTFLELHHHGYLDATSKQLEEQGLRLLQGFVEKAQAQQVMKPISSELLMALIYGAFVGLLKGHTHGYLKLTPATLAAAEQIMWEAIRL